MTDSNNPLEVPPIDRPDWPPNEPGTFAVLVGVEFDQTGIHALEHARRLDSSQAKVLVHVAHVIPDTNASARQRVVDRHAKELETAPDQLRAFVAKHFGESGQGWRFHVRMGDPTDTLLQLALDYDIEMIVVGTHGRTGLKKLVFGSVAQKLVEAARCPVLIASPRDFSGMNKTMIPDPKCPDCEVARAESGGARMWCEHHARPHVRPHTVGGGGLDTGGHDPSIVPPSGR